MEILESEKDLPGYELNKSTRDAFLLVPFDESEEILSQRFENNADVGGFRRNMRERVKKGNNMLSSRMGGREGSHTREQLYLISGCFGITPGRFDDFES